MLSHFLTFGLSFLPKAFAVTLPAAYCNGTIGCGGGPANIVYSALVGNDGIAQMMLRIAAGLAVLFIIAAGVQMVISLGDESKITQYKWAMAYSLIGFCVVIVAQFIVASVGSENYGQIGDATQLPFNILSNAARLLRTVLNVLFVLIMVVAGLRMLYAQGKSDEFETGKKMLTWAIVGAVLINLATAFVIAVTDFFGIS